MTEARRARILIVDDDLMTRDVVALALREAGHEVEACATAQSGLAAVARGGTDLVLLNARMRPASSETCRAMKRTTTAGYLPVALLVSRGDDQARIDGILGQADDLVGKPLERGELLARVEALLERRRLWERMEESAKAFSTARGVCPLTRCLSVHALGELLPRAFARAEAHCEPLAIAVVDVDHLKEENATLGRDAGDRVLVRVAGALGESVRDSDSVARHGEDEFLVVLPGAHFAGVMKVAERMFGDVSAALADLGSDGITVSVGVALFPSRDVRTLPGLLHAAHVALAKAKREGGDHVSVFQQEGLFYTRAGKKGAA